MDESRRRFLGGLGAAATLGATRPVAAATRTGYDLLVIGAGTAGIPAAIFAAERGARVLVIDVASEIGGTLLLSSGQMSAAGTRAQRAKGIVDTPDEHYADLMRISRGTVDPAIARLAVDHAAPAFEWLVDNGYELLPDYPVAGIAHEPYSKPRYYWATLRGLAVLGAMRPSFERAVRRGRIDLRLEHRAAAFETDTAGAITTTIAEDSGGRRVRLQARHVLLASGGYASNATLFRRYSGHPKYLDRSYPHAQGDGLAIAESVGGYVRYAEKYLTNFGVVLATDDVPTQQLASAVFRPQQRQPWEIYVNARGERFVRENVPSVDAREQSLRFQPGLRHWAVFDENVLRNAPPFLANWTRESLREAFEAKRPNFHVADTVPELARAAGLPDAALVASVEGYNYGVQTGNDFLGRRHLPTKLETPPFYAIRHQGTSITSTAGVAVDDRLRVVRRDGSHVSNLYAAGEILGSGATQGQAFCGGMMVTPAVAFGRLLGSTLIPLA